MTRGLGAAIVVWGCGHAAPVPVPSAGVSAKPVASATIVIDAGVPDAAPLDADPQRLAARTIEMLRACGQAVISASDCADAAARLDSAIDSNREVIDANAHVQHGEPAMRDALAHALEARAGDMIEVGTQLVTAPLARKCASEPGFRAALDRLRGQP